MFVIDHDQRITAVYGEWIRTGRSSASRYVGKRMLDEWPKEIVTLHAAMNARALEGQVVVYDWEYPVPGSGRRMLTTICPLYDGEGAVRCAIRATRLLTAGARAHAAQAVHLADGTTPGMSRSGPVARATPPPEVMFRLSPREGLIAMMMMDSARAAQIARDLKISVHTARQHIKHILKKARVHSQEELIDLLRGKAGAVTRPRRSARARR